MTNIVSGKPSTMAKQKRSKYIFIAAFILLIILVFASYTTTAVFWDGAFPSGEYHLRILNQSGEPIDGAILNIYQGKSQAFEYPFDNYLSENGLVSNEMGEIVITHAPRGLEFGGSGWLLFWVIPINMGSPKFSCEITASGYKPLRFSVRQVFETSYNNSNAPKKTVQINGNEVELRVFEQTVILKTE